MNRKNLQFRKIEPWPGVSSKDWQDWKWQLRNSLKTEQALNNHLVLTPSEKVALEQGQKLFRVQTTPYYTQLMDRNNNHCPIRQMVVPQSQELESGWQQMLDPLGENKKENRATDRLIHRYTDRALFLVTDLCAVYCRYCTRKHFTASDQVLATTRQLSLAVDYVRAHPEIKEVLFSGGDPLSLSNEKLEVYLQAFYNIPHVELIRVGSRMPVVCPMRVDEGLLNLFKKYQPIYLMTHFNHPDELAEDSAIALEKLVDHGIPVFNQLVLLNGINNHPDLIYALSRRLLVLRVKPYYMFQADPSMGTDHLRTSIEDSLDIQRSLWGHSSGLSMPTYIVDIPDGGGKTALTPNHITALEGQRHSFTGWDQVSADYISPPKNQIRKPLVSPLYQRFPASAELKKD